MARGHPRDFERYVANFGIPSDPVKYELFPTYDYSGGDDSRERDRPRKEYFNKSLLCTVLGCHIYKTVIDEERVLWMLKLFLGKFGYSQRDVLYGTEIAIDCRCYGARERLKAAGIIDILVQDLKFDQLSCQAVSRQLGRKIVDRHWHSAHEDPEKQKLVDSARTDLFECKSSLSGKLPVFLSSLSHFESSSLK